MLGVGMRGREGRGEAGEESNVQMYIEQANSGNIWAR